MSFTYSGGIITQTGTDTDISGITGLTGVTVYDNVYILDNVFLRVEGTLSFNGYSERIVFVNPDDSSTGLDYMSIYVDDGGSLTINCDNGVATGGFVQTNALLSCIDFGTRSISGPSGATNYNGGRKFFSVHPNGFIRLTGVFVGENSRSQGILTSFDGVAELVDCILLTKTALGNTQYSFKGTALIQNSTFIGGILTDRGATYTFDGFVVGEADAGFLFGGGAVGNTHTTVVDFSTYNTSSQDLRINMSGTTQYGTVIFVDSQKDANNMIVTMSDGSGFNFCVWQSNLTLNFVDTNLAPKDVKVYAEDVDNGSRFGTVVVSGGTDITDDTKIYQGVTTSGSISFLPYTAFSTEIGGVYTIDNRGDSDGSDFAFKFCDYNSLLGSTMPNLVGTGVKVVSSTVLPDTSITEPTKATVDAYVTIDDAFELYDRSKSYLFDNFVGETETIVSRSGAQVVLVDQDLVIDATAGSIFSYSDPTITIKSSTFTGGATATTGTLTTQNGTLLNGGTFDCDIIYDSGASTTITNVIHTGAFDLPQAGTYTIDGGKLDEVTNSSGGAVTISLINGAIITTNTGPNITITTPATLTVSVNVTGADVVILAAGTDTVLDSVDAQAGTDFGYFYTTAQNIDIGVIKQGRIVNYTYNYALTGSDATLPITLLNDRNYS